MYNVILRYRPTLSRPTFTKIYIRIQMIFLTLLTFDSIKKVRTIFLSSLFLPFIIWFQKLLYPKICITIYSTKIHQREQLVYYKQHFKGRCHQAEPQKCQLENSSKTFQNSQSRFVQVRFPRHIWYQKPNPFWGTADAWGKVHLK